MLMNKEKLIAFFKKETILCISGALAFVSAFIIPPDAGYIEYCDIRVLVLLFCLMAVMGGFQQLGVFDRMANLLLARARKMRQLATTLVMLCFFSAMFVTNDVALITFVPFTIMLLERANLREKMIPFIVMQTIAANLGSMLTPVGNPQNLFLFSLSKMDVGDFVMLMLPLAAVSLIVLVIMTLMTGNNAGESNVKPAEEEKGNSFLNVRFFVYAVLFVVCLLNVFHVIPYEEVVYSTALEYAFVVVTEMLAGLIMGFMSNVAYYILSFAGQIIDQEIGFSMVNQYDPITSTQVTITGNLYTYAVMLMVMITNMHHYLIRAITDSFQVIPVGGVVFDFNLYEVMKRFVVDYFVIGFRIVLPIFASLLVVNTILAILARVAPQMNMFVIGLQLKVFVGLFVLVLMVMMITGVADLVFQESMSILRETVPYLGGADG